MPLPCPHRDGYVTPAGAPHDEAADLFDHLGDRHYPDQEGLFHELAGMMRNLPVPTK